jgi:PAS domain S-box-containing protein
LEELRQRNIELEGSEMDRKLQNNEIRLNQLINSSHDWVWEVDQNGVYTYASPFCREVLGYSPEEIIRKTPFDIMPPEEAERVGKVFQTYVAEQRPFYRVENLNRHKDGHTVILETNGQPIIDEKGRFRGYRGMDRDITARRRMEEALRKSEEKFRLAFHSSPEALGIIRVQDGVYVDVNQSFCNITGFSREELIGKTSLEINVWANPEDRSRFVEALRIKNKVEDMEIKFRLKDGRKVTTGFKGCFRTNSHAPPFGAWHHES